MVPFLTWADPLNGLAFRGGALELGVNAHWGLQMGLDTLARQHRSDPRALYEAISALCREIDELGPSGYASLPLAEFAPLRRQPVLPAFFDRIAQPSDPAPLEPLTIAGKYDQANVPTFNVGGWYDIFLADSIANFQAMRRLGRPTKLLIGPWSHTRHTNPIGELNFGIGAQISFINLQADFGRLQLRWFDHWLKGVDTGIMAEAPIRLFVMGANVWRDEQEWPLQRARETPFYLHSNGELSTDAPDMEAPDRYTYDPADPVPTHGGAILMAPEFLTGPIDQSVLEARPDVLTYTTQPLERDTEVTGPVRVQLWAYRPVGDKQRLQSRTSHSVAGVLEQFSPLGPQSQHGPSLRPRCRALCGPANHPARWRPSVTGVAAASARGLTLAPSLKTFHLVNRFPATRSRCCA